jgi:hypothetical protein
MGATADRITTRGQQSCDSRSAGASSLAIARVFRVPLDSVFHDPDLEGDSA